MPMFGFFQPPSEEEQQEMKEAYERHRMSIEEFQHAFQRLFDELKEDQLKTLQTAFQILMDPNNHATAGQWEGMVAWQRKVRYNICVTCGVNHDEELSPPPHAPDEDPKATELQQVIDPVLHDPDAIDLFADLTPDQRELANKYHIDDLRDSTTGELIGFYCTGINGMKEPCGMKYPSIKDRMLRGPEHCSGCFQRMAQG